MKPHHLLIIATILPSLLCASISSNSELQAATTASVPFQLISPAEYNALLELSNGNPFVSQTRLIRSGSEVISELIKNIVNGLITPVNITGLDPIENSLLKPSIDKSHGYPFCTIQNNRNVQHSQRSYDAVLDPASNFGTFSINFFHPGTVNIDTYDEDFNMEELEPLVNQNVPSTSTSRPTIDFNKDKPGGNSMVTPPTAPVINCIVVLKEPTPTPTPTPSTPAPLMLRPSKRPQYPTIPSMPQYPRDPQFPIGPYQVVQLPYPPFLGLIETPPSSAFPNWPNWLGSQTFASNPISSSPLSSPWPFWTMNPPQSNTNSQAATWPFLAIPSQASNNHIQSTASPFWPTINTNAENVVPLPSIPNPAAWFRPPPHAMSQQQQLHPTQHQLHYNGNANDIRSVQQHQQQRDETVPENKENQEDVLIAESRNSHSKQSRRIGGKLI